MEFNDALRAIKLGRAMAVLGAGFSMDAKAAATNEKLPVGGALANNLMASIDSTDSADYGLAAELYSKVHRKDPTALATFLKRQFEVGEAQAEHLEFAKYSWRNIYTTNFDNLVEVASKQVGFARRAVTTGRTPADHDRSEPWIVHLHGYVGDLSGQGFIPPFVLSRSSYLDMDLPRTPWPTKLQTDAAAAAAIFVIGHSLADLHIAKMLRNTAPNIRKTFIILEEHPSAALVAYAEQFGTVKPIGLKGLITALADTPDPTQEDKGSRPLLAFNEIKLPEETRSPSPDDVNHLLLGGAFDSAVYLNSLLDTSRPYTFNRNQALRRLEAWNGQPRKLLAYSRIGNGKTLFLRQAAIQFAQHGYRVFEGTHLLENAYAELDQIRSTTGPFAFIYDGVREYEEPIKAVAQSLDPRDVLIVATRPTAFATDFQNLRNVLGEGFQRIDLDVLPMADIVELDKLLEFYGLWGSIGGRSQGARLNFIRDDCGGETRSVVLHVFRNSHISQAIREPIAQLKKEHPKFIQVLAALLTVRLADALVDYFDVCELMGVDPDDVREIFDRTGIVDFFPGDGEPLRAKSAILAEHVLGSLIPAADCSVALSVLVERLVDFRTADERYEDSIPKILRFAVITKIFRGSSRRPFISDLYEKILEAAYLRADPQFWLQYAMAKMEEKDWSSAEKLLETAYSTSKVRQGYRTYMLDNQMARFHLISTIDGYQTDIDGTAEKISDLIYRRLAQMGSDIDIYVYRLAQPLIQFRDQFESSAIAVKAMDTLILNLRDRLSDARGRRALDDEENRVWQLLSRR